MYTEQHAKHSPTPVASPGLKSQVYPTIYQYLGEAGIVAFPHGIGAM